MRLRPRSGIARLIVSKSALKRALLLLQAIYIEAERRGYGVAPHSGYDVAGVALVIRGHHYPVSIHELHLREPMTSDDLARWRKEHEWRLRWGGTLSPPTQKVDPETGGSRFPCPPSMTAHGVAGRKGRVARSNESFPASSLLSRNELSRTTDGRRSELAKPRSVNSVSSSNLRPSVSHSSRTFASNG
jgi:hypothetical protein